MHADTEKLMDATQLAECLLSGKTSSIHIVVALEDMAEEGIFLISATDLCMRLMQTPTPVEQVREIDEFLEQGSLVIQWTLPLYQDGAQGFALAKQDSLH